MSEEPVILGAAGTRSTQEPGQDGSASPFPIPLGESSQQQRRDTGGQPQLDLLRLQDGDPRGRGLALPLGWKLCSTTRDKGLLLPVSSSKWCVHAHKERGYTFKFPFSTSCGLFLEQGHSSSPVSCCQHWSLQFAQESLKGAAA